MKLFLLNVLLRLASCSFGSNRLSFTLAEITSPFVIESDYVYSTHTSGTAPSPGLGDISFCVNVPISASATDLLWLETKCPNG